MIRKLYFGGLRDIVFFSRLWFQPRGDDNKRDNRLRASGKTCHPFTPPASPSWIPAFAGMTAGVGMGLSLFRQPLCYS